VAETLNLSFILDKSGWNQIKILKYFHLIRAIYVIKNILYRDHLKENNLAWTFDEKIVLNKYFTHTESSSNENNLALTFDE
jgi:hypothetical protein